jgi:hypothetical protein
LTEGARCGVRRALVAVAEETRHLILDGAPEHEARTESAELTEAVGIEKVSGKKVHPSGHAGVPPQVGDALHEATPLHFSSSQRTPPSLVR